MNTVMYIRLIGLVGGGLIGWNIALYLSRVADNGLALALQLALVLLAALLGVIIAPYVTTQPLRWLRRRLKMMAAIDILAATIGLVLGLVVAALLAIPLSQLPGEMGRLLPSAGAIVFGYLGIYLMVMRRGEFLDILGGMNPSAAVSLDGTRRASHTSEKFILVDTSAIIDGRIADISQTGFIDGVLLIPRFVLTELQRIADSPDALRRNRGRRGLEMLKRLQKDSIVPIQISEIDADGVPDVDSKLVKIGRTHHYPVLTNDYNLNRVAELQGVRVLNINDLANSLKPAYLPGEDMHVRVIQEGKEFNQGLAYLDDGTMIVVENGRRYLDRDVDVAVTRVLQTAQGRMIFATIKEPQREAG
ncbi:MAG TPA: PIN domain-containing protein [Chloroflexia bacterium]|nr:PIN domain-containing protein [Chloroflexia bacterium]